MHCHVLNKTYATGNFPGEDWERGKPSLLVKPTNRPLRIPGPMRGSLMWGPGTPPIPCLSMLHQSRSTGHPALPPSSKILRAPSNPQPPLHGLGFFPLRHGAPCAPFTPALEGFPAPSNWWVKVAPWEYGRKGEIHPNQQPQPLRMSSPSLSHVSQN